MYLAGILGLCLLLKGLALSLSNSTKPVFAASAAPQPAPAQPDSPQTDSAKPTTSQAQPDNAQSTEPQPQKETPAQPNPVPPEAGQKPAPTKPHTPAKKKHPAPLAAQSPQKKVIREGSTADPSTQLAPGVSQEQVRRQRQTTNQLLSSTDVALQKLSGQTLSSDQQETVTQIRKFMEQSKAADEDGDLQLAYKLALKAHLLSDGLSKQ